VTGSTLREIAGRALWALPRPFALAELLDGGYGLRSVLFHHLAEVDSPLTRGLGVTLSPSLFEDRLRFVLRHFRPVSLERIVSDGSLPPRAILVTFDDAYGSVPRVAAPILARLGIPAVFFVNAGLLENRRVALDNLVCFAANRVGFSLLEDAAKRGAGESLRARNVHEVLLQFLPSLSREAQAGFHAALEAAVGDDALDLVRQQALNATEQEIFALAAAGIEIGSHSLTHSWCRSLLTDDDLRQELELNQRELERITGRRVRCFSVPYGSSRDLTGRVRATLRTLGNQSTFLVEGRANRREDVPGLVDRVSLRGASDAATFLEIEVLPRLRRLRRSPVVLPADATAESPAPR